MLLEKVVVFFFSAENRKGLSPELWERKKKIPVKQCSLMIMVCLDSMSFLALSDVVVIVTLASRCL